MARNALLNIAGHVAPLLGAFIAVPFLVRGMGTERFGILTIIWLVIGYFSLFDLGLGTATTKLVAEKLGARREDEVPRLLKTVVVMLGFLGAAGTAIVLGLSSWLVTSAMKVPAILQKETLQSVHLLAFAIPLVILTTCYRGTLEAYQRFDLVNVVRIPLGLLTFFGPLVVLTYSKSLVPVTVVLIVFRGISMIIYRKQCRSILPSGTTGADWKDELRPLLAYGSWVTVSSIISPVMVYFDRFLISAYVSVAAVAYYAMPFEIVTKLWVVAGALVGVLFPAFSATVKNDRSGTVRLLSRAWAVLFIAIFPVVMIGTTLAHECLDLWLGRAFADNSQYVLQVLTAGVFINCFAQIAFALVQSAGRPDVTAKAHLFELPLYLLSLWWLIRTYGVLGAAIAWLLRIIIDSTILFYFTIRIVPESFDSVKRLAMIVAIAIVSGICIAQVQALAVKIACLVSAMVLIGGGAWVFLVSQQDKDSVVNGLSSVLSLPVLKRGGKS